MSVSTALERLATRWAGAASAERSNAQLYLTELADALGVERPRPSGTGYEFEYPIRIVTRDGTETVKRADLFKQGCFLLEAKDQSAESSKDILLRKAFGQAVEYAVFVAGDPPPYLMVLDVGSTVILWDRWHGTYGGFQAGYRIDLRKLSLHQDNIQLLQDVWENPEVRDPRAKTEFVTREIAGHLAELASSLEQRGYEQDRVARFLIRIVFTLFAEDVDLLPDRPLEKLLDLTLKDPDDFCGAVVELWQAMDVGGRFGVRRLLKYNGRFFQEAEALPLNREDLAVLLEAAKSDWAQVEPSIFGTLFTRALDPAERHRLGAEFTPPSYVERLVRVTIEEPVRSEWTIVQAELIQLRARGRSTDLKKALEQLRKFHKSLRQLQILDPACGSGNFLYMALAALKRIELEVIRETEAITGHPELQIEEVNPSQFHGIEIKPWAREISELTLWIGYHQWWRQTHGHAQPPEPILQDTGTLDCRDAVLAWESLEEDPSRSRPDPTPRIPNPITGDLVPDPEAVLTYWEYKNPQQASWPQADFIVGNPPYMGRGRQREAFGDGYIDALRSTYPDVPKNADYVMYWWHRAAKEVAEGRCRRAGLITTNTIRQRHNRAVIDRARELGAMVTWTIPDHPWIDEAGSAAVRVSMTVIAPTTEDSSLVTVDEDGRVTNVRRVTHLNSDLTAHADVARAASEPLLANKGLSSQGFILVGDGFILDPKEARVFAKTDPEARNIVKRYLTGRDLARKPREQYVIDFALMDHDQIREHPVLYDVVRTRVKPMRDSNNDRSTRVKWWRFGRNREEFRPALENLVRFIATVETSKHRFFVFLPMRTIPSHTIVCVALDDFYHLGLLSSAIHTIWALAAGGRLGVGNDPRYQKACCFDSFPLPDPEPVDRRRVETIVEKLNSHRDRALKTDDSVTMTGIYNVLQKLRNSARLTPAERKVNDLAACGTLVDLHDALDASVAQCYGWPWPMTDSEILEHLVALHDQRKEEEFEGKVRWLRQEYQEARFPEVGDKKSPKPRKALTSIPKKAPRIKSPWPDSAADQIAAVKLAVDECLGTVDEISKRFIGARRAMVKRHLETLELLAEIHRTTDGRFHSSSKPEALQGSVPLSQPGKV